MEQRGGQEGGGIVGRDGAAKPVVVLEAGQKFQRQTVDAERVFEARVAGPRVDQRDEPQLADAGEPPKSRRIDQRLHPRRERHGHAGGNTNPRRRGAEGGEFGHGGSKRGRHRR